VLEGQREIERERGGWKRVDQRESVRACGTGCAVRVRVKEACTERARERERERERWRPPPRLPFHSHTCVAGELLGALWDGLFLAFHLALSLSSWALVPIQVSHCNALIKAHEASTGTRFSWVLKTRPDFLFLRPFPSLAVSTTPRCPPGVGAQVPIFGETEDKRFPPPLCVARLALNTVFMSLTIVHRALLIVAISTQSFRSDGPVFLNRFRADHHFFCPRDRCDGFLSKASTLQLSCEAGVDFGFGSK